MDAPAARRRTPIATLVTAIGLAMSFFHLWIAWYGPPDALTLRTVHLAFALVLAFLTLAPRKGAAADAPGWAEALLVCASLVACGYLIVEREYVPKVPTEVRLARPSDRPNPLWPTEGVQSQLGRRAEHALRFHAADLRAPDLPVTG